MNLVLIPSNIGNGWNVSNLGISGMTMLTNGLCGSIEPEIGSNCSWIGTKAYPESISLRADVYTIMLGTNDAKWYNWFDLQNNSTDSFVLDYLDLVLQLKALKTPSPRVILLTSPPLYAPYPYGMNATVINSFLPSLVKRIAGVAKVEVIDLHELYLKAAKPSWTCDGCHPGELGEERLECEGNSFKKQQTLLGIHSLPKQLWKHCYKHHSLLILSCTSKSTLTSLC